VYTRIAMVNARIGMVNAYFGDREQVTDSADCTSGRAVSRVRE